MEKSNRDDIKVAVPEGGVLVLELFGPNPNSTKPNGSIFERPTPNEWKTKWPRNIDFLFVCTGFCVGLGNLWRFPSVALQYGGGSFLIAYFSLLVLIGIPIFYLEVVLGQFVSRAGARLFDCVPILRGLGYVQMFMSIVVASYYSGLTAVSGKFLTDSIQYVLPWTLCTDESSKYCSFGSSHWRANKMNGSHSLAEIYYREKISPDVQMNFLVQTLTPNYELAIYLLVCWIFVGLIVCKGPRLLSNLGGFLVFAYLSILLVTFAQVIQLPGATEGIIYFFTPKWKVLANLEMWYSALIQVFFSLGICFGPLVMYSSFNRFSYNMFLDILITVFINILIVLAAGCTFFGVVGSIVHSSSHSFDDFYNRFYYIPLVLYAEIIGKINFVPQITSAIIFLLFCLLGITSISALTFFTVQMIRDEFLIKQTWKSTVLVSIGMFLTSCIYLAPIGKYLTILLDSYGVPIGIGLNSILELTAFAWIYGVKRICDDIEFMFGFRTRYYWRVIWCAIPVVVIMAFVPLLVYGAIHLFSTNGFSLTKIGYVVGCIFMAIVFTSILLWSVCVLIKQQQTSKFSQKFRHASTPDSNWGPADSSLLLNYRYFILKKDNTTI